MPVSVKTVLPVDGEPAAVRNSTRSYPSGTAVNRTPGGGIDVHDAAGNVVGGHADGTWTAYAVRAAGTPDPGDGGASPSDED